MCMGQIVIKGDTTPKSFCGSQLEWNDIVHRANLQKWEVIALRLYTGPMFRWYNSVLRFFGEPHDATRAPFDSYKARGNSENCPFVTTIHVLNSAILKLSRQQPAQKVFRGTKGLLPAEFWNLNESGVRGGIELAFMSTTLDRTVVSSSFSKSKQGDLEPSLIFESQMGMVDRGAAVEWCTQFPGQEEILFAPLTGMEVVGEPTVDGSAIVVHTRLNSNLQRGNNALGEPESVVGRAVEVHCGGR